MGERLAPRMQDGDGADLGAEPARIGGERGQGFGRRLEQDRVDDCLVLERHGRDRRGQREDDMEIGNGQEFGLAGGQPLGPRCSLTLRAMPVAAGVIGDARGPQPSQVSTWPPSAAVRHAMIALMTRRSTRPR